MPRRRSGLPGIRNTKEAVSWSRNPSVFLDTERVWTGPEAKLVRDLRKASLVPPLNLAATTRLPISKTWRRTVTWNPKRSSLACSKSQANTLYIPRRNSCLNNFKNVNTKHPSLYVHSWEFCYKDANSLVLGIALYLLFFFLPSAKINNEEELPHWPRICRYGMAD